jgi:hypothetical protein
MTKSRKQASIGEAAAILVQTGTLRGTTLTSGDLSGKGYRKSRRKLYRQEYRLDDVPAFNRELMRVPRRTPSALEREAQDRVSLGDQNIWRLSACRRGVRIQNSS